MPRVEKSIYWRVKRPVRLWPGICRGPRAGGWRTVSRRDTASFQKGLTFNCRRRHPLPALVCWSPQLGTKERAEQPPVHSSPSRQHAPASTCPQRGWDMREDRVAAPVGRAGTHQVLGPFTHPCLMCTYYASHCCRPERDIRVQKKNKICSHGAYHSNNQTDHRKNKTLANRKHQIIKQL